MCQNNLQNATVMKQTGQNMKKKNKKKQKQQHNNQHKGQ